MAKKERQTTIFHNTSDGKCYIYGDFDTDEGKTEERIQRIGFFSPMIRDMDSDDSVELKISPAAMYERKVVEETDDNKRIYTNDDFKDKLVIIPSADNTRESGLADMSVDDTGEYYVSVKDAMEGTSVEEESAGDESVMNVFFTGKNVRYLYDGKTYSINTSMDKGNWWWPITFTDTEMYKDWVGNDNGSLSLTSMPNRQSLSSAIDKNNVFTIKFISDDIPNPSHIYIFFGRRYICEKLEVNIEEGHVAKEKTGYFYSYL